MREIEAMLREESRELNRVVVPEELEERLRAALETRRKRPPYILAAAVAALFLLLFASNFNAIAFYARQILGFDRIMTGTLKDLNELGRGQLIDRSCTLDNGIRIILEGVMVDGNRLIAFITQENMAADPVEDVPHFILKGPFGNCYGGGSGYGEVTDDGTAVKYVFSFDPPGPLEKHLTLGLSCLVDGVFHEGEIRFALDRSKAMGFSLKEEISRTIDLDDGGRIDFNTIAISPSMTTIEGSLLLPAGALSREDSFPQLMGTYLELKLLADGREIPSEGGRLGSRSPGKYTFKMSFDTLPPDTAVIEIILTALSDHKKVNRLVELTPGEMEIPLVLEGNAVVLKKLETTPEQTVLTLETDLKNPLIEEAYLSAGGVRVPLVGIEGGIVEESGGKQAAVEWKFVFERMPRCDRYDLEIGTINYVRNYDRSVTIPVK